VVRPLDADHRRNALRVSARRSTVAAADIRSMLIRREISLNEFALELTHVRVEKRNGVGILPIPLVLIEREFELCQVP
jgi:hypothetical protein